MPAPGVSARGRALPPRTSPLICLVRGVAVRGRQGPEGSWPSRYFSTPDPEKYVYSVKAGTAGRPVNSTASLTAMLSPRAGAPRVGGRRCKYGLDWRKRQLSKGPMSLSRDFHCGFANELFTILQREMIIIITFPIPKLSLLCSFPLLEKFSEVCHQAKCKKE